VLTRKEKMYQKERKKKCVSKRKKEKRMSCWSFEFGKGTGGTHHAIFQTAKIQRKLGRLAVVNKKEKRSAAFVPGGKKMTKLAE
jgi:hypothetical protein